MCALRHITNYVKRYCICRGQAVKSCIHKSKELPARRRRGGEGEEGCWNEDREQLAISSMSGVSAGATKGAGGRAERASGSQRRGGPSDTACKGQRTQDGVEWRMRRGTKQGVNVQRDGEKGKEGGEKQRVPVKGLRSGQHRRGTGRVRHRRHVNLRKIIR